MSVFRSIATGYLGAKIRNTEANDALKARVLETAGTTLLTETIPDAVAAEKERKSNYDILVGRFGVNGGNLMDASGYTLNENTMSKLEDDLKANNLNEEAIKNANFETSFENRYNARVKSDQEKYNPILKQLGIDGIGSLGYNTVEALVKPESMQTTTKDQMTDTVVTEQTPIEYSSMQMGDYFDPMRSTVDLGTPNQVDQAIQGFRGFDQGIIRDATGAFVGMELFGEKANERNAFKAVMTRIAPNYVVGDTNKADLTSTAGTANQVLFDQTQGYIGDQVLDGYQSATFKEKIRDKSFDINRYNASGFSETFNNTYQTDEAKIVALVNYMNDNLPTRSERLHFAQSFAANIKDSDGNNYRDLLLIAIDPTLIIQNN